MPIKTVPLPEQAADILLHIQSPFNIAASGTGGGQSAHALTTASSTKQHTKRALHALLPFISDLLKEELLQLDATDPATAFQLCTATARLTADACSLP